MPGHGTGLGAGNFPAANKLLMRYEHDRAYKQHMQKVSLFKMPYFVFMFRSNNFITLFENMKCK